MISEKLFPNSDSLRRVLPNQGTYIIVSYLCTFLLGAVPGSGRTRGSYKPQNQYNCASQGFGERDRTVSYNAYSLQLRWLSSVYTQAVSIWEACGPFTVSGCTPRKPPTPL